MRYTRNATFLYRQGQVIAANRDDGCWVKFSQECKNILDNAIEEDLSGTNLIDSFSSKEDKDYIRKLIQNLHKAGIVSEEKEEDEAQNLIETVDLSITNRCNLQCIHCAASADSRNGIDPLATQEWFEIIDKISECNPKLVTFTGGEPLVREDIFELLEYTSTHTSARITLMTNATLITNEVIARKIAMYCSSVDISIDGYDEETCSQIRGKGTFARVLKGIELLKKVGVKNITLSMVHTKITANDRRRFEEFCESLGVKAIVRRLSIVGRAVDHEDQLKIRYGDIESTNIEEDRAEVHPTIIRACTCKAGRKSYSINHKGYIYPCSPMDNEAFNLGNILDFASLKSMILNDGLRGEGMKEFEQYSAYGTLCEECDVRYFCWTCPFRAFDLMKNSEKFEEYCAISKPYYTELLWGE